MTETKAEYKTEGIDLSALARDMLRWEQMKRQLDEMEQAIKDTVLQLEKTQTVGNVRATYSNPRKGYDYATPGLAAPRKIVEAHTSPVTDWRAVCKEAKIDPIVTPGEGPGSVSIKLLN